jgi:basic membrane protein A and related proteins
MQARRAHALASLAVAAMLVGAAGCAEKSAPAKPAAKSTGPLIGLVFDIGGRGDKSFNDAAYAGLERAKKELGIEYVTLETGEGTDREAQLRQLAAGDAQLIFGVGFLFSDDIKALAKEFPQKKFACIDYTVVPGEVLPPNLVALKFREQDGSYLVGALAGLLNKTGTVGFVGGMEIPLIKKFEAGYCAGVRAVKPNVKVIVKYAGNTGAAFKDPTKGKELGLAEYHAGADIIYHAAGSTGLGVFEAARETKRLAIGVDSDQYSEAPGFILTSMVKRVDTAVFADIRDLEAGTWTGGVHEFGLGDNGVSWVHDEHNAALIPDAVRAQVDSLQREIVAGRIHPPEK